MLLKSRHKPLYQSGFSMIEVLVALLLISIGVLGMIAMQGKTIQYTADSVERNKAAMLGSNLLESMRASPKALYDVKDQMATQSDFFKAKGSAFPTAPSSCTPLPDAIKGPPGMLGGTGEERTARRWRPAEERLLHLPQLEAGRLRRQGLHAGNPPGLARQARRLRQRRRQQRRHLPLLLHPQGRAMSMNNRSRRQSGLSMIELLVALAISSFLILGITQIYLDNKRNYLFQQGQAGNQENGRFAMMFLDQQLAKVGFRRRADDPNEFAFPAQQKTAYCEAFKAGSTLVPAVVKAGQSGFCYRYQPAPGEAYDCEGNSITTPSDPFATAQAITARVLFVPATADAPGSLACSAQTIKEKGQEIVSGLVDFKLEYGVGPTMAGKREVESFVEQANIADRPVRALRYSALMASDKNLRQGDSKTLDDWITLYPSSKTSLQGNDKDRLYQIAKGSQTLRNLVP